MYAHEPPKHIHMWETSVCVMCAWLIVCAMDRLTHRPSERTETEKDELKWYRYGKRMWLYTNNTLLCMWMLWTWHKYMSVTRFMCFMPFDSYFYLLNVDTHLLLLFVAYCGSLFVAYLGPRALVGKSQRQWRMVAQQHTLAHIHALAVVCARKMVSKHEYYCEHLRGHREWTFPFIHYFRLFFL